jgi:hypothetical protein
MKSSLLYWAILALWLVTALPVLLWSALVAEIPWRPNFSSESTLEGITIWAVFAAWFYVTPILLLVFRKRAIAGARRTIQHAED